MWFKLFCYVFLQNIFHPIFQLLFQNFTKHFFFLINCPRFSDLTNPKNMTFSNTKKLSLLLRTAGLSVTHPEAGAFSGGAAFDSSGTELPSLASFGVPSCFGAGLSWDAAVVLPTAPTFGRTLNRDRRNILTLKQKRRKQVRTPTDSPENHLQP